jgi:hypothetical protein
VVGFAFLGEFNVAVGERKSGETVGGRDHQPVVDAAYLDGRWWRFGAGAGDAVGGDVKVEIAIPIGIGEGEGRGAVPSNQSGPVVLGELSLAVVAEEAGADAQPVHEKVEVRVAIEVGEHGAGGELSGAGDARLGGDVGEPPVAEIAMERVGGFGTAEVDIAAAIAIDIPEGDTGAVFKDLIVEGGGGADVVGERNAKAPGGGDGGETGGSVGRRNGRLPTVTGGRVPGI